MYLWNVIKGPYLLIGFGQLCSIVGNHWFKMHLKDSEYQRTICLHRKCHQRTTIHLHAAPSSTFQAACHTQAVRWHPTDSWHIKERDAPTQGALLSSSDAHRQHSGSWERFPNTSRQTSALPDTALNETDCLSKASGLFCDLFKTWAQNSMCE